MPRRKQTPKRPRSSTTSMDTSKDDSVIESAQRPITQWLENGSGETPDACTETQGSPDDHLYKAITTLTRQINTLTQRFNTESSSIGSQLSEIQHQNASLLEELAHVKSENVELKKEIDGLKRRVVEADAKNNDLEQWTRRSNIRINGVPDERDEDYELSERKVVELLKDKINVNVKTNDIDIAHRIGRFTEGKPRPLIVKFSSRKTKIAVMKAKNQLKNIDRKIYINEDLTKLNAELFHQIRNLSESKKTWTREGKIYAKGENGLIFRIDRNTQLDVLKRDMTAPASTNTNSPSRPYTTFLTSTPV